MAAAHAATPSTSGRLGAAPGGRSPPLLGARCPQRRAGRARPTATAALPELEALYGGGQAVASQEQLAAALQQLPIDPLLAFELPNPLAAFHWQQPVYVQWLSYLLAHPVVTAGLALFLYLAIPRIWRAFVKWVVTPAILLGLAYVVVTNPSTFSNAGGFITSFTADHPYATSGAIMVGLVLLLSPYLLTVLLVLFLAVGIPRLPAPLQRFLPEPVVEFERTLAGFSDATRGPVEGLKSQAGRLGSDVQSALRGLGLGQEAPALSK